MKVSVILFSVRSELFRRPVQQRAATYLLTSWLWYVSSALMNSYILQLSFQRPFVLCVPAIELIKYLQRTEVRDALLNALIALLKPTNQEVHKHKILQGMTSLPFAHEPYIRTGQVGTISFFFNNCYRLLYNPNVLGSDYFISNLKRCMLKRWCGKEKGWVVLVVVVIIQSQKGPGSRMLDISSQSAWSQDFLNKAKWHMHSSGSMEWSDLQILICLWLLLQIRRWPRSAARYRCSSSRQRQPKPYGETHRNVDIQEDIHTYRQEDRQTDRQIRKMHIQRLIDRADRRPYNMQCFGPTNTPSIPALLPVQW